MKKWARTARMNMASFYSAELQRRQCKFATIRDKPEIVGYSKM